MSDASRRSGWMEAHRLRFFVVPLLIVVALVGMGVLALPLVAALEPTLNLPVDAATYLGGSNTDQSTAIDVAPDGTVVLAGTMPGYQPATPAATVLLGGGNGTIVRLNRTGNTVLSVTRIGSDVADMEVDSTGRIAVCGSFGVALLNATASAVLWNDNPGSASRCAIGTDGTTAALVSDTVHIYAADGSVIGTWQVGGTQQADIALDTATRQVFATGYTQKTSNLQVAFIRAWSYTSRTPTWTGYDFSASEVTSANLGSDTRGRLITIGRDGKLYFAGSINGGTGASIFARHPDDIARNASDRTVQNDNYNRPTQVGSVSMTWYGRYNPTSGALELGQSLLTRLSSGNGNSITVNGLMADETGRLFLAGSSACCGDQRNDRQVAGQLVGSYEGSEAFFLVVSSTFQQRIVWTPFARGGVSAGNSPAIGVSVRNGVAAVAINLNRENQSTRALITHNALQANPGGLRTPYLAVWQLNSTSNPISTPTSTQVPVLSTATATATQVPVLSTATATATQVPGQPTATATATQVPGQPTATATTTLVPGQPTATATTTLVPGQPTATAVPGQPTVTPTSTLGDRPQIVQMMPAFGFNNRSTELVVQGLNFAPDAQVRLGNRALITTRINETALLAVVPAGLAPDTYTVIVRNPGNRESQRTAAYTVLDADDADYDDLFASSNDLWLDPAPPRANVPVQLGLLVQRRGGKVPLENVTVEFRSDTMDGPLLGTATVPFLDPYSSIESTIPVTIIFPQSGTFTIYAIIDPEDQVAESNDQNNVVGRTIAVADTHEDQVPPRVDRTDINGSSNTIVSTRDIMVDIWASDLASDDSGVEAVHIIEYIYSQGAQQWVPVAQSGWMPYATTPARYPWSLVPLPGMHYLQVRVRDQAQNISVRAVNQLVNYEVPIDSIEAGETRIYRYVVAEGQEWHVDLEVQSGDADLYVWSSNGNTPPWVSNQEGSSDEQVIISADNVESGVYQIEVHGYTRAQYRLLTRIGTPQEGMLAQEYSILSEARPRLTEPVVAVNNMPDERSGSILPSTPLPQTGQAVYLPLVIR